MRLGALHKLVVRDLVRVRGALVTSGFGIMAGTAALVFFLALGLGVRDVLLGEVFPIDQVELEPPKGSSFGQIASFAFGGKAKAPRIEPADIAALEASPDVAAVYPKLQFSFPASARGGKELLGRDLNTGEMIADGIDPELVGDVGDIPFRDPLSVCTGDDPKRPCTPCATTKECTAPQYCEAKQDERGFCVDPVPAVISRYIIELFDKSVAPAHGYPQIGEKLLERAEGMIFRMWIGESYLGQAKTGTPRWVHARVVGISDRAIDLGLTLPIDTVRRWNVEFSGEGAGDAYSSVMVKVAANDRVGQVVALADELGLKPRDTRARDVSVLLSGVMALLALVAGIILVVSASNIAYTFRVLVNDRRREIALYRALGATRGDMMAWLLALALTVGVAGGAAGVLVAWLASLGADRLGETRLPDFPFKPDTFFAFPLWLVLGALAFASMFALLGALGPARRAGRVDPAAALASLS
ncbi:MAG: ABC transporter permease [Bacteroidota bacterium]